MKEKVIYNIHKFSNSVDSDIFEQIYVLNQENTPEVGSLSSIKDLQDLIRLSSINYYVISKDKIIGFIICFREQSAYNSAHNFKDIAHNSATISQQFCAQFYGNCPRCSWFCG